MQYFQPCFNKCEACSQSLVLRCSPKRTTSMRKGGLSLNPSPLKFIWKGLRAGSTWKSSGQKCVFLNNFHLIRNVFWIYIYLQSNYQNVPREEYFPSEASEVTLPEATFRHKSKNSTPKKSRGFVPDPNPTILCGFCTWHKAWSHP